MFKKTLLAAAAVSLTLAAGIAQADTSGKKIALSNNYAGNSWRQAMLKSWDKVTSKAVSGGIVAEDNQDKQGVSLDNIGTEWRHVALVYEGTANALRLYVDGELVLSSSFIYDQVTNADLEETVFTMGGASWPAVLNGLMDDAKYYDQILSEAEIGLISSQ